MGKKTDRLTQTARYLKSAQNLEVDSKKSHRKLRYAAIGIGFLLLLLVYVAVHRPVILVPYGLDKKVSVSVSRVTPYYLMLLSRDDAATYFDVTPITIDNNMALFLSRVAPRYVGQVQLMVKKRSAVFKNSDKSAIFYPGATAVVKGYHVTLTGRLIEMMSNKIVRNTEKTLNVTYENINGQLFIKAWS